MEVRELVEAEAEIIPVHEETVLHEKAAEANPEQEERENQEGLAQGAEGALELQVEPAPGEQAAEVQPQEEEADLAAKLEEPREEDEGEGIPEAGVLPEVGVLPVVEEEAIRELVALQEEEEEMAAFPEEAALPAEVAPRGVAMEETETEAEAHRRLQHLYR